MLDLKYLANELKTQDNRSTSDPLFCVYDIEKVYGVDPNFNDKAEVLYYWKDNPEYTYHTYEEALKAVIDNGEKEEDFDDYIDKIYYLKIDKFISAHLTLKAAEQYIKEERHYLEEPKIYVLSQYRCHEFNEVINYLKEQNK